MSSFNVLDKKKRDGVCPKVFLLQNSQKRTLERANSVMFLYKRCYEPPWCDPRSLLGKLRKNLLDWSKISDRNCGIYRTSCKKSKIKHVKCILFVLIPDTKRFYGKLIAWRRLVNNLTRFINKHAAGPSENCVGYLHSGKKDNNTNREMSIGNKRPRRRPEEASFVFISWFRSCLCLDLIQL